MKPEVEIYDTTLRDGSQGEGVNFSVMDKLRIAEKLDAFGIHYIEGGWPGSNPKDIEFFAEAKRKKFKNARLASISRRTTWRSRFARQNDLAMSINGGRPGHGGLAGLWHGVVEPRIDSSAFLLSNPHFIT